ncbi:MAG: PTS sugar transporter subunit IIC [Endomicrobia bacterium]|nr:PTS sugar transporter subunit IIC [Endomicrobiia bacterium]
MILSLNFLFLALISGLIHLDTLVLGQFMFSRPIVCGPIIGYFTGSLTNGLLMGAIFELLYISIIPVGIKIPPDSTTATIFSIVCSNLTKCLALGVFLGVLVGWIYKYIDIFLRNVNSMTLSWVDNAKIEFVERRVNFLVLYGIISSYLKTVLFYLIFFPIVGAIAIMVCKTVMKFNIFVNELIYLLPSIGIGIGLYHFTEK